MFGVKKEKKKVFVGLSGGVDSAVSAALLQKQGYDVTGVFIRIALSGYPCSAGEDKIEAMRVAAHLRISFLELDLSKEYEKRVFDTSIAEFAKGKTPNPDALCNREIKFGAFYDFAKSRGADFIATGHYARVASQNLPLRRDEREPYSSAENFAYPETLLFAGTDKEKDQSYFLWAVPETVLRYTLFPVGGLQKNKVRALAKEFGLPNAQKKDSQGLCFLGDISLGDMLLQELEPFPGDVLSEGGAIVGRHAGAVLYTLGQRHGFEMFARTPHTPPHFVVAKDVQKNTLVVSTSKFPQNAVGTKIILRETNWIGTPGEGAYQARFRYRQKLIPARLSADLTTTTLLEPHYVPEGQSLVLYQGERCLGGGVIARADLVDSVDN